VAGVVTREWIAGLRVDRARPRCDGSGSPIVFVHGMWGGSWYFENYLRFAAATGREGWAVNLRGHHGSRPVADLGRVTFAEYVRDVEDVLDTVGPAVVVGHSMGGLIAQAVASRADVTAAVFMASVPPPGIPLLTWPLLRHASRYALAALRGRAFCVGRADARALALNALPAPERDAIARRFVPDSGRVAWQLAFGDVEPPRPFTCPALVVGAGRDRLTPVGRQRRIAAHYGADYHEIAHGGHMLPVEQGWHAGIGRVLAWIAACERSWPSPAAPDRRGAVIER
jgi:pimeloyl-ACP methyl ester carboxylesterase